MASRLRSRLRAGGGGDTFTPADISFTSGLWLDQSDISTAFQDSAGSTPVTAAGQFVGKRNDKSGNALHVVQATSAARPQYDVIGGIASDYNDGLDDRYGLAFAAGTLVADMDCFFAVKKTVGTAVVLCANAETGTKYFGYAASGSSATATDTSGTPTYYVDGVQLAGGTAVTAGTLYTALNDGAWHIVEVRNLNLSGWAGFYVGQNTLYLNGDIGGIIVPPAQSTAYRNSLRTWLGNKVGKSL